MHNAHIIIIQQKIREAKQKCTDMPVFLTKRQFAIGGESGGFKLPVVLVFWSQDAAAGAAPLLHIELCVNPVFQQFLQNDKVLQPVAQITHLHLCIQCHHR